MNTQLNHATRCTCGHTLAAHQTLLDQPIPTGWLDFQPELGDQEFTTVCGIPECRCMEFQKREDAHALPR